MTPAIATTLLIILALLALATIFALFRAIRFTPIIPLAALILATATTSISAEQFMFWGSASLIALALLYLIPRSVATSRIGVPYIVGGAIVGTAVGAAISLSPSAFIIGALLGSICGAIAFSRTPAGHLLAFPSRQFFNYLCAKALPAIVAINAITISILSLLNHMSAL